MSLTMQPSCALLNAGIFITSPTSMANLWSGNKSLQTNIQVDETNKHVGEHSDYGLHIIETDACSYLMTA